MECLDDRDESIRLRALDLISGMVSKKNLMDIVKKLILHMDLSESASTSAVVCLFTVSAQGPFHTTKPAFHEQELCAGGTFLPFVSKQG